MLRRLRFQLTGLYILVAVGLVALTSLGTYALLNYYFQRETDLALKYKMSTLFRQYNLVLSPELVQAEQDWHETQALQLPGSANIQQTVSVSKHEGEDEGEEDHEAKAETQIPLIPSNRDEDEWEERYDAQLASIYVLALGANGEIIPMPGWVQPPFFPDEAATHAAMVNGYDLRTVNAGDDTRIRLLTYRLDDPSGPFLLQIGRTLIDQERVLEQFLVGLVLLGAISSISLGLGSWWLSGKSLGPAQRSWDQQQAFVSNASHELRTPLTLIKASAEVSLRAHPVEEQKQLLEDILGECDYMNRLVDDLLLLSRLDTRRIELARGPVALDALLEETVQQAHKLVAEKNITLEMRPVQGVVLGDPMRLRQVLLILLDNAIWFTPEGGIIRIEAAKRRKTCQIVVSDNGKGIAPEHLPHVFERFYQVNLDSNASPRSNGLGLSIAKAVIDALNGDIHIQSQVGKGTRVVIELPAMNEAPTGK